MKLQIFSIFDKAMGIYMPPFYVRAVGQATRMFIDEINNPQERMFNHATDYELFHIGEWTDDTCEHITAKPTLIIRGGDAKNRTE